MLRVGTRSLTRRVVLTAKPFTSPNALHLGFFNNGYTSQSQYAMTMTVRALTTQVPTPNNEKKQVAAKDTSETTEVTVSKRQMVINGLKTVGATVKGWIMNPKQTWQSIKDEAHHYWVGSKLLWSEIKVTKQILHRVAQGHELTRRERKQLLRTSTDIFRLIPFAIIVIIPFMELLLPVILKVFPNMLPSTFEDKAKQQADMKNELQMRISVSKFMQETLQEIASKKANSDVADVKDLTHFIEQARLGNPIPNDKVIQMAKLFKDELTLANVARPQLVSMCRYMNLQTFGSDAFLRFQLRTKLRNIKEDDRRILWEGVDSLNTLELKEACRERGMQSVGLTQFKLRHQLSEWLELSTQKNIPISLLIMSRAFMLTSPSDDPEVVLKSSMSALDSDTINEIVIASAPASAEKSIEVQKRKLESLKFQQEMIEEELQGVDEIKKKRAAEKALEEEKKRAESLEVTLNAAVAKAEAEIKPIPPSNSGVAKDHAQPGKPVEEDSRVVNRIDHKI